MVVGEDAVLGHPDAQQGSDQDQAGQPQVEVSPDQAAPKHSGQHICGQHQGGVQEPEEERPRCPQLAGHPPDLLQAERGLEGAAGGVAPQVHDLILRGRRSFLSCSLPGDSQSLPAVGVAPHVTRAPECMVDKNNPPHPPPNTSGNIVVLLVVTLLWSTHIQSKQRIYSTVTPPLSFSC